MAPIQVRFSLLDSFKEQYFLESNIITADHVA
jgi:hypothetical protein